MAKRTKYVYWDRFMDRATLVIDLGGTKIAAASFKGTELLKEVKRATPSSSIATAIEEIIEEFAAYHPLKGVVVGVPGQVFQGVVTKAPNLNWENLPLEALLKKRFSIPILIHNDVQLALLGEWRFGALKSVQNGLLCYVGTGIGGGLILNGAPYRGATGSAGEIGHMRLFPTSVSCGCGGKGCLEAIAGGKEHPSKELLVEALTAASITCINLLNLEKLIFGGGVIEALPDLVPKIEQATFNGILPQARKGLSVEKGKLGHLAPLLGGASLFK